MTRPGANYENDLFSLSDNECTGDALATLFNKSEFPSREALMHNPLFDFNDLSHG
jgi:hypothetical protein